MVHCGTDSPAGIDEFVTAIAVDTIKTKQPDLLAVHLVDLDSMRHEYGVLMIKQRSCYQDGSPSRTDH